MRGDSTDATLSTITAGDQVTFIEHSGVFRFRRVNGSVNTLIAYLDTTNGGGRLLDSTTYSFAANMNQNVRTSDSPAFAGVTSSGTVAAAGGPSGGFLSSTYSSGYNRIWAFGNATPYGLGYYQGGTDYIGFHFGDTASPKYSFYQSGNMTLTGNITPAVNATQNLGSASLRWNIVYSSDLSLKNEFGDYTLVEGEKDLYLYNNKLNKVFKFLLEEVDPSTAPPKKQE
jgi:hypothetical protein